MPILKRIFATEPASNASLSSAPGKFGIFAARRAAVRARSESAAYETLLEQCWDALWRYAYHTTGNADEAGDLLSETVIEGFKSFSQFRGETTFLRWMYRVMTTTRIDMVRRAKRHIAQSLESAREMGEAVCEIPDEAANPEVIVVGAMLSEPVQKALAALSEEFRAVVVLADIERLDYTEVGHILQIPVGTVRSRLHRARAQLRTMLAAYVEERW
ncbi:MAG TPA: sigma-70 family RNA polymerase sigma factor [Chthonomonadaceae bacterium]|nr:sigma-70 family RNA polymerase sigma factor [Chthonomonadaceae bacterium]